MIEQGISAILHTISQWILIPCLLMLVVLVLAAVWQIGEILVEVLVERRKRANIPLLIQAIHQDQADLNQIVEESVLPRRHKRLLHALIDTSHLPPGSRTALARELLSKEEGRYSRITGMSDVLARLGPIFGLLGTLIPLGPGIVALGQGDTQTLSKSLSMAFDTTVVGIISGAVGAVISQVRKHWYGSDLTSLEALMECILEEASTGVEK